MKNSRSLVNEYPEGVEVIIPAKKGIFVNFFLTAWLMGWAYGEAVIINRLLNNEGQVPDAFIILFACGWTLSGLLATLIWLWNNKGCEIIRISEDELKRIRQYVWFSRSKIYQTKHIDNMRVTDLSPASLEIEGGIEFWGLSGGTITFDYGPDIAKIGLGINDDEARQIISVIKSRYQRF